MSAFIEDGYHQTAYIKGLFGQYEDVWVEFRVATALENAHLDARKAQQTPTPETTEELICTQIAGHVRKWTISRRDGSVVEPTEANVSRVHPALRMRIFNIVEGFASPDQPQGEPPAGYENVIAKPAREDVADKQGN